MSRRDTIIMAVLLNTGLLAILFVVAMNPDEDHIVQQLDFHNAFVEVEVQEKPTVRQEAPVVLAHQSAGDEVDNVLKDFAATMSSETFVNASTHVGVSHQEIVAMNEENVTKPKQPSRVTSNVKDHQPEYVEVTVKQGDILGRIAQANGTTISAIKRVNNLATDKLHIGQVLKIPVNAKLNSNTSSRLGSTQTDDGFARYYTLENGDNPWKIAKKFNVSVNELLRLNDLDESKARSLRPGDRVRVH